MSGRSIGFNPELRTVTATFTRPADTTQYAALDAVGTASTNVMSLALPQKSSGRIVKTVLMKSTATVTLSTFRIHFYTTAVTGIADNAANTILYANAAGYVGSIDPAIMIAASSGAAVTTTRLDP